MRDFEKEFDAKEAASRKFFAKVTLGALVLGLIIAAFLAFITL